VSVREGRIDPKVNTATGVVVTGTGSDSTVIKAPKVTWADIVRKQTNTNVVPAAAAVSAVKYVVRAGGHASAARGQQALKNCKFVSKKSFYRNNPVNKTSKV
jgi:hypothetical protein